MATGPQAFFCLWQDSRIRETLFELLPKEGICNVRLASSACCNLVTKRLFLRTNVTFTANTFTRHSRIQALSRIGHHIHHLTFTFPHTDATFLPPLIHPESGREISFLYTPHTSMASVLERPKFANTGLGEILTTQYPPLFHAASNVPSFINAMKHIPNMRHLTIKTPGQDPKERYRRDIIDYALISLRISMERAPINKLTKLTLSSVHPSAFIYLRHVGGFGCLPSAGRRWKQIRKIHIFAESWDFYGPSPGLDHLKMIEDYICSFSTSLEKLTFTWLGRKGPCPIALAADLLFAPPRSSQKLFHEVTSPMSPLPPAPARKPVVFQKLRFLAVRNAVMRAPQVADLVALHQHTVREFDFENTFLLDDGSWDDALAPLMDNGSHSGYWSRHSTATITEEAAGIQPEYLSVDPPEPSAAVEAVSQELCNIDLEDDEDLDLEIQVEEEYEDEVVPDLDSDVEAARIASLSFSNKFKKRCITKRRRRRKPGHEHQEGQHEEERHHCRQRSNDTLDELRDGHHHRQHQRSLDSLDEEHPTALVRPNHSRQPSNNSLHCHPQEPPRLSMAHQSSRPRLFGEVDSVYSTASSSHRLFGEVTSQLSSHAGSEPYLTHSPTTDEEEEGDSLIDSYFRPRTPTSPPTHHLPSAPAPSPGSKTNTATATTTALLQPTVYDPTAELCSEISAVQRDIAAEEKHRLVAENPDVQVSGLRRAKELVLSRLGREFCTANPGAGAGGGLGGPRKESFGGSSSGFLGSARFREGLFGGKSTMPTPVVGATPRLTAGFGSGYGQDHRSMDVPILFRRG
ncbi:Uu.00g136810.m01.CDS01 [Anthostomella pinea]|uniref:Uu.00g136810.m01.CDS01 n=1 Tax=Anthostomella pinea TaxID=933095 RepID=A0AAI8YIM4_9PEZI|nr:Uu.00g136810.m01.CDS01 [Anthostomella pinea]